MFSYLRLGQPDCENLLLNLHLGHLVFHKLLLTYRDAYHRGIQWDTHNVFIVPWCIQIERNICLQYRFGQYR